MNIRAFWILAAVLGAAVNIGIVIGWLGVRASNRTLWILAGVLGVLGVLAIAAGITEAAIGHAH